MRRRVPWLVPLFGALVGVVMVASPGLASTAGTWTETAPLLGRRTEDFVATLLPQAGTHTRVLVADGFGSDGTPLAESEIYDVQNNAWKPTGSLNEARGEANWVKLKSGKILVAG